MYLVIQLLRDEARWVRWNWRAAFASTDFVILKDTTVQLFVERHNWTKQGLES